MIAGDMKNTLLNLWQLINGLETRVPLLECCASTVLLVGRRPRASGISLASYERAIDKLFESKNLKASPRSIRRWVPSAERTYLQTPRDLAAEKELPLVSFCEDVAASGGYWLACAGDQIFADPNSIVGSIGVISAFRVSGTNRAFRNREARYATNSRKGMLDPFQDEKPEDIDRLRGLQEDIFENFKAHVRERRGDRLRADETTLFCGDVWTGNHALEIGLIDGLTDMRTEMKRRYGAKVKFQSAELRRGLLSRLRMGRTLAIDPSHLVWALDDWSLWKRYGL